MATPGFSRPPYLAGQFGMPLFGIAGIKPFTGNYFWVDSGNGSDGNSGGPSDPLSTLSQALSFCAAGNNDVVLLTGTVNTTATVNWNKNRTHLIGLCPDAQANARARIAPAGGASVFTPLVNVTASECMFINVGASHGFASATPQICWQDSGGNNSYTGCSFQGMAHATAAAQAGGRSLVVSAGGENLFDTCQIGGDTVTRSAANASLELASGTARNTFRNCIFPMMTSSAASVFGLTAGAAAIDRWQWFQNCVFINASGSGSTAITQAFTMPASAGGVLMLSSCSLLGGNAATNWGDASGMLQMWVDGGAPATLTSGLAVNPT
jgi:hypothetical protein